MLLGEPPTTQADLHFRLFGFPIRVHPLFWVVSLLLGMGGGDAKPVSVLIWIVVVFVSILVHELGHAFLQRYFGGRPWITLYSLGGLASCDDCDRSPRAQVLISLAGPAAGFLLAGLLILALNVSGYPSGFVLNPDRIDFDALGVGRVLVQRFSFGAFYFAPFASNAVNEVIGQALVVNILWGLVNLLPIYPLDGGRVSRELFTLRQPRDGIVRSLQLSIGTAVLVAIYALTRNSIFTTVMFGFLAYENFQALQAYRYWR